MLTRRLVLADPEEDEAAVAVRDVDGRIRSVPASSQLAQRFELNTSTQANSPGDGVRLTGLPNGRSSRVRHRGAPDVPGLVGSSGCGTGELGEGAEGESREEGRELHCGRNEKGGTEEEGRERGGSGRELAWSWGFGTYGGPPL